MSAMVMERPGIEGLTPVERAIPEPGGAEVLVRVRACGVGGTVLRKVRGLRQEQLPLIPGHEITGEIAALGPGVTGLDAGSRIMVYTYVGCGRCEHCWRDQTSLCKHTPNREAWLAGEHWDAGFRIGEDSDGGFAEYVVIPARNAIPLEEGVSYLDATLAVDAIATSLRVLKRGELMPGERVLVVGAAGGLGVHLMQVARWFGAEVVAVDLPDKLERLGEYGAAEVIDGAQSDWRPSMSSAVDVAVDFVGTPATLSASLASLSDRGRLLIMTPDVGVEVPVPTRLMVAGERQILGSKSHSQADVSEGAELLARSVIKPVISDVRPLEEVKEMLFALEDNSLFARGGITFD